MNVCHYDSVASIRDLFGCIVQFLGDASILNCTACCNKRYARALSFVAPAGQYPVDIVLKNIHKVARFKRAMLAYRNPDELKCLTRLSHRVESLRLYDHTRGTNRVVDLVKYLPLGLKSLRLNIDGRAFSNPSSVYFHRTLTELDLVNHDHPLITELFPDSLQTLSLQLKQQIILPNMLPHSLKSLTVLSPLQSINDQHFPSSLTSLSWESTSAQPLEDIRYLASLRSLTIKAQTGQVLSATSLLPSSLEEFNLEDTYDELVVFTALPRSLKVFNNCPIFTRAMAEWLSSLERVKCSTSAFHPDQFAFSLPCLKILDLSEFGEWNGSLDGLPESLEELSFGYHFNQPIKALPSKLKILKLGDGFAQQINPGVLPDSLVCLSFGRTFDHVLPPLPLQLERLHFKTTSEFRQPFVHSFPPCLRVLRLPSHYECPFILPVPSNLCVIK